MDDALLPKDLLLLSEDDAQTLLSAVNVVVGMMQKTTTDDERARSSRFGKLVQLQAKMKDAILSRLGDEPCTNS